jgi:hypothetical protein
MLLIFRYLKENTLRMILTHNFEEGTLIDDVNMHTIPKDASNNNFHTRPQFRKEHI